MTIKRVIKILTVLAVLTICSCTTKQDNSNGLFIEEAMNSQLLGKDIRLFTITSLNDTIRFIKVNADTTQAKPVILFLQGSLPIPLLFETGDNDYFVSALNNFDYQTLSKKYNFVLISKPHTPIVANDNYLNHQYAYVPDISKPYDFDTNYLRDNHLLKHVEQSNAVLQFLRQQEWVKNDSIILLGHSQGAHIVVHLAEQNPDILALGYFGGNVLGRFTGIIMEQRVAAIKGKISQEEAQSNIEFWYNWWQDVCRRGEKIYPTDPVHTWKSFSSQYIEKFVALKMPVFIAYGTEDICALSCDLLPVFFELAGKTNYKMRPFVGMGHNFEEITPDGKSNWDNMYWDTAINEFINWVNNNENIP